jgi:hypothetical protein
MFLTSICRLRLVCNRDGGRSRKVGVKVLGGSSILCYLFLSRATAEKRINDRTVSISVHTI